MKECEHALGLGSRRCSRGERGDDLAALVIEACAREGTSLESGDIVIVTSKIVSKAEGRVRPQIEREAAFAEETVRVVAARDRGASLTRIVENRLGIVGAAAGIDASNTAPGTVLLLSLDPDASARALAAALRAAKAPPRHPARTTRATDEPAARLQGLRGAVRSA
ncbi:coenzyme F420-0:L-glutamate ligase [Microbacterium lacticum]